MSKPFAIYCLSVARSKVTHMAGVHGNRALIARHEVGTPLGKRLVPFLSGNSIRSSALRRPGFHWLVEVCGLDHSLTKPELYFLLGGGAGYVGGGRESAQLICELKEVCPLAGLLGGALPHQIVAGSVCVDMGRLVCAEETANLDTFLPDGVSVADLALRPANGWIGSWDLTRSSAADGLSLTTDHEIDAAERQRAWEAYVDENGDPKKNRPDSPALMWLPGEDTVQDGGRLRVKSRQMIWGGECVIPGAAFAHRFLLIHPSRLEIGAVLLSLALWREQGNLIGGMAARGHGILDTSIVHDDLDGDPVAEYVAHVEAHRGQVGAWLRAQFRKEATAKPKKGKKVLA